MGVLSDGDADHRCMLMYGGVFQILHRNRAQKYFNVMKTTFEDRFIF